MWLGVQDQCAGITMDLGLEEMGNSIHMLILYSWSNVGAHEKA